MKKTSPSLNSKDNNLEKEQYLYLTTRGRKSGAPREIEIWFTHREGRFYLIAEYATSNWVQNLIASPEVEVRVAENSFKARARVIPGESSLSQAVQQLSRDKHGWGDGLIVELTPENQEMKTENWISRSCLAFPCDPLCPLWLNSSHVFGRYSDPGSPAS